MVGFVKIWELSTKRNDYGLTEVEVSFSITYDDGQIISTKVIFGKYDYKHSDILTCIKKYFKGELIYNG